LADIWIADIGGHPHKHWKPRNTRNIVYYQQLKVQHYPQQTRNGAQHFRKSGKNCREND